ncbi:hypothetical protein LINGRAHAP2_LOCUS30736 [Linum grandiflorum]
MDTYKARFNQGSLEFRLDQKRAIRFK